jgi:hypothetical protein
MSKAEFKIGDVAVPGNPELTTLSSDSGCHSHAIVVSVEPFAMVSDDGKKIWCNEKPENYAAITVVHPDILSVAMDSWKRHCQRLSMPVTDWVPTIRFCSEFDTWKPIGAAMDSMMGHGGERVFQVMRLDCTIGHAFFGYDAKFYVNMNDAYIPGQNQAFVLANPGLFFAWRKLRKDC